jgi:hypothetical protein
MDAEKVGCPPTLPAAISAPILAFVAALAMALKRSSEVRKVAHPFERARELRSEIPVRGAGGEHRPKSVAVTRTKSLR